MFSKTDLPKIEEIPVPKFFNWGQGGRYTTAKIKRVFSKEDGSLGISYRNKIATRGSFDSDRALWSTEFLD